MLSLQNKPYIAVIGDLVKSKQLENRYQVQEKLKHILEETNKIYDDDLASNFTITLGDEFQGLFHTGVHLIDILTNIEMQMEPVKLRFGIGIGRISTNILKEVSLGADGPAYYKAREAVDYLKELEKKRMKSDTNVRVKFEEDDYHYEPMLNTIFSLQSTIKNEWSTRQREIIWDLLQHQDGQIQVAKRFGIKQPAVQKNLASANYYAYKEALDTLSMIFSQLV